jgi:hypothetical protein
VLVDEAISGDIAAIKEIAGRIDGKVPQAHTDGDGGPLTIRLIQFADVDADDPAE